MQSPGELKYLIPDPGDLSKMPDSGTSASGIAVDDQGSIYAADVGFNNLRKVREGSIAFSDGRRCGAFIAVCYRHCESV